MLRRTALLGLLLLAAVGLPAAVRHVPAGYATIQAAIDAAAHGDTVLVEHGTYYENVRFRGKKILVASTYLLTRDQADVEATVINGSQPAHPDTASCVLFIAGEDTNSVLEGFTLTGGTGTLWRDIHNTRLYREGGGILLEFTSPIIRYNIIRNNEAVNTAGATSAGGGGIRIGDANPRIIGNVIAFNRGRYGGGIVLNYTAALIRGNVIYRNTGGEDFGGSGIWATNNGAGAKIIENNTIVENSSVLDGGGIQIGSTSATIRNNIVWGNTAPAGAQLDLSGGTFTVQYNDVQDGYPGTGNISADPAFLDTMHVLQPGSPCIDAGDPSPAFNDPADSLIPGAARYPSQGGVRNDMGAYGGASRTALHVRTHRNAPRPVTGARAYSDYLTPTSVTLTWTDPALLVNGQPLAAFHVRLYRDGALAAVVDSGVGTYTDTGLVLHQHYAYLLAAFTAIDSGDAATAAAYAGGSAVPGAPSAFVALDGAGGVELHWVNPARQTDGTPLNDLAFIRIYRDGALLDSLAQSMADTGQGRTYADTALGYHQYTVDAVDDEAPRHASAATALLFGYGGITTTYAASFEAGRGSAYVTGGWDTTSAAAYDGTHALTDSPGGNYAVPTASAVLLPPVIVGANYVLQFENIAILRGGHFAYVEISADHRASFTTLKTYNWYLFPEWSDGVAGAGDWRKFTFDLSAYAGDTVTVRFRMNAQSGLPADGWYLDSVVVGPFAAGVATTVAMAQDWNMVSVPRLLPSMAIDSVFPGHVGTAFGYRKAYEAATLLRHGVGYWVKMDSARSVDLAGAAILRDTFAVTARWNMIGSLSQSIDSAALVQSPAGLLQSSFYRYDPDSGYLAATRLEPGRAYWVKVSQQGRLIASLLYPTANPAVAPRSLPAAPWGVVAATDARGRRALLPFDAVDGTPVARELPPQPPTGAFDARLEPSTGEGSFTLLLRSAAYPVRLSWRPAPGAPRAVAVATAAGDGLLRDGGELSLPSPGAVTLRLAGAPALPARFTVAQNYPNPFNPATTVRYDLPAPAVVRVSVVNLLGEEVALLADGPAEPGAHLVRWDAAAMPSGVYYCRVSAAERTLVVPMMLLR